MSVVKDFKINNARIIIDDEFVREDYTEIILEHIAATTKPALMEAGLALLEEAESQTETLPSPANSDLPPPSLPCPSVLNLGAK